MQESPEAKAKRLALLCARYRGGDMRRALAELSATLGPFVALIVVMSLVTDIHYGLALLIAPLASGFLVRIFIIQHDCGHGSFFPSRRANDAAGRILSIFTFTPYGAWRHEHALHHKGSAHLERRGVGDIKLLTVREYAALTRFGRMRYRLLRNPLFLVCIGGPVYFMILNRVPWGRSVPAHEISGSIFGLDAVLLVAFLITGQLFGFMSVAAIVIPIAIGASMIGVWLFYVQHQFEDAQWYDGRTWSFRVAALYGSSYYCLPRPLAWLTGYIGIHTIHHLNLGIPFYRLPECLDAAPELKSFNRLTFWGSVSDSVRYKLWDEDRRCLVGYPR